MSGSVRLTDVQITAMMVERVAAPVPLHLADDVIERVREVARREPRARQTRNSRGIMLLLAAAIAIGGVFAILGTAGSRNEARPAPTPASSAASAVSPQPTTSTLPGAGQSCVDFFLMAETGGIGTGLAPMPGAASGRAVNGSLIALAGGKSGGVNPSVLDPLGPEPSFAPVASWGMDSLGVNRWAIAADGTAIAAELSETGCAPDVFVMRRDGTGLRRPFSLPGREAFAAAWSPAGGQLAAVTAPSSPVVGSLGLSLSTLVLWDPASGRVTDLGRPCATCQPVGRGDSPHGSLAFSPGGTRIAVDYNDTACGTVSDPHPDNADCRGIALVTTDGTWSLLPQPSEESLPVELVGWKDEATLIVVWNDVVGRLDLGSGRLTTLGVRISAPFWQLTDALSPDRSRVFSWESGPSLTVVDLTTGATTDVGPFPTDVLAVSWSPDSRQIIAQADRDGFGADRGLYLAPADGSAAPRRVYLGGAGVMAWLPAPATP